jgi:hypothetical protein
LIVNTWNGVGHKAGDQEDKEDSNAISVMWVGGGKYRPSTNQQEEEECLEEDEDEDDSGGDFLLEEADPLFRRSNLMEVVEEEEAEEEEEPLFVLELTAEEHAATRCFHFPNGSGACDTSMTGSITEV